MKKTSSKNCFGIALLAVMGYGTPHASDSGIWIQAGWPNGDNTQGEGFCPWLLGLRQLLALTLLMVAF